MARSRATLVLAATLTACGGTARSAAPPHAEGDLAWLSGTWTARSEGALLEERWSAAESGALVGTFRVVNTADGPFLVELLALTRQGDEWILHMRHFAPTLAHWNSRDRILEYRATATPRPELDFHVSGADRVRRIVYRRDGDVLTVTLHREGEPETIRFTRAP